MNIGHEPRCARPDDDAGHKIAHQRRHLDALGEEAKDKRNTKAGRKRGDQGDVVVHLKLFYFRSKTRPGVRQNRHPAIRLPHKQRVAFALHALRKIQPRLTTLFGHGTDHTSDKVRVLASVLTAGNEFQESQL